MSPETLRRVERSYQSVAADLPALAAAFYGRLFAARPDLRPLFREDMTLQTRHLAASIELVARNAAMLDALEEPLRELGAEHARAGVLPADYPPVLETLLAVLAEALPPDADGPDAAADVLAGWRQLLETISRHMLAGAAAAGTGPR